MHFRRSSPAAVTPTTSGTAAVTTPPSFSGLNERESLFVVEYVARSGTVGAGADAALAAGYSNGNRNAAHSMASRLLRRPAVLRAIKEETGQRIAAAAPLGIAVLEALAQSARSEQVRLAAANSLVDRGYGPVVSRSANLNVGTSIEDLIDKVDQQEREKAKTIDGEAIDVTPSDPADPDAKKLALLKRYRAGG